MNVDRSRDISFGIRTNFHFCTREEEGVEFVRIFRDRREAYAKIELSTVRKPRHRDDGDPPANTRGKPDAGLHASYSRGSLS